LKKKCFQHLEQKPPPGEQENIVAVVTQVGPNVVNSNQKLGFLGGTPANFNGFRDLAALLHGSQVVSVSQTMRH